MGRPDDSARPARAEEVLAEYIARREDGDELSFDAFCAEHADLDPVLRRLHANWQGFVRAAEAAGRDRRRSVRAARRADPSSARKLLQRLEARAQSGERYRFQEELARGGMGAILRVWDADLRRDLAMKVQLETPGQGVRRLPESAGESAAIERFLEEAQVTAQLDHPGIVPVHELGVDRDGRSYFTMKLVRGRTLAEVFRFVLGGAPGWTRVRALGVLLKVCEAVGYAHAKGVIHRDLKPGNVMVGQFGEVYVMDWGLSKVLGRADTRGARLAPAASAAENLVRTDRQASVEADPASPLLTRDGSVLGTPAYMPPEQARGEIEEMGPAADVYSIGAILYELLAGSMPYAVPGECPSNHDVLSRLLLGPPRPLGELAEGAPGELVAICERAMARAPSERYPDIGAMAEDLRAYLEGRVVRAYESGTLAELKKWVLRNRALAATVSGGAALVLALSTAGSLLLARKNEQLRSTNDDLTSANTQLEAKTHEAQRERDVARAINDFLNDDLLASVAPSARKGRGKDVSMREALDAAAERIGGRFAGQPEVEAAIRATLGDTYCALGEYARAEPQLERALALRRGALGASDVKTLGSAANLARLYQQQDQYEKAETLLRDCLETCRAALGGAHRETLAVLAQLAAGTMEQGRYLEAEPLWRNYMEALREAHGLARGDVLAARHEQGWVYLELGRLAEAEPLLLESLEVRRAELGDGDPATLVSRSALGVLRARQGRYEEAEQIDLECLEAMRGVLDGEHPDLLRALRELAWLHHRQGRYLEAEARYSECVEPLRRRLGEAHMDTLDALHGLARVHEALGRYGEAEALYRECLEKHRQARRAAPVVLGGLGSLLRRQGRNEEAETLLRECLEQSRRMLGRTHPETLAALNNLAVVYDKLGRPEAAEPIYRECWESTCQALGRTHPDALVEANNLATCLLGQGRHDEAEPLLSECLAAKREVQGPAHPSTLSTQASLGAMLLEQGRIAEAEPLLSDCLDERRAALGEAHDDTLRSLVQLADLRRLQGRLEEADAAARTAEQGLRESLGEGHASTLNARRVLAAVLREQGRLEEAEQLLVATLATMRERLGPGHRNTLRAQEELARAYCARGRLDEAEALAADLIERTRETDPRHDETVDLLQRIRAARQATESER